LERFAAEKPLQAFKTLEGVNKSTRFFGFAIRNLPQSGVFSPDCNNKTKVLIKYSPFQKFKTFGKVCCVVKPLQAFKTLAGYRAVIFHFFIKLFFISLQ